MTQRLTKALLTPQHAQELRFVSIGECMVEMAPAGLPDQYQKRFAGDTFNTAWYLNALRPSWHCRYVSRVGSDAVSQEMLAMMAAAGIDTGHVQICERRTVGLYLISLNQGERSFSYWRDHSAARQLGDDRAALVAATADAEVIYFSGITLAILDAAGRANLLALLAEARVAGNTIAFDPNMRPRLWSSPEEMRATILAAAAVSDIVLPSFDEESDHFGDTEEAGVIDRYAAAGVHSVIVKNGANPIQYRHMGQQGSVQPVPLHQLVDTTSAGDSFNAGLFAALGTGAPIEAAIRHASGVARQVIGQRGALVALDLTLIETS